MNRPAFLSWPTVRPLAYAAPVAAGLALAAAVIPAGMASAATAALPSNCTQSGATVTCTYGYTGAPVTWAVPSGVSSAALTLDGGSGADAVGTSSSLITADPGSGGAGAEVTGTLSLSGISSLTLNVAGAGDSDGLGGYGGGGTTKFDGSAGGGGGGATTVSDSAGTLLVAGGGGGGGAEAVVNHNLGGDERASGGAGGNGGDAGQPGQPGAAGQSNGGLDLGGGGGGGAGTPSAGGAGGSGGTGEWSDNPDQFTQGQDGMPGSTGQGGGSGPVGAGGGGGGGYFGGGQGGQGSSCNDSSCKLAYPQVVTDAYGGTSVVGITAMGAFGGGGGGSSFTGGPGFSGATVTTAPGYGADGKVVISYQPPAPVQVPVTVTGTQVYGSSPSFTASYTAPDGITVSGSVTCDTVGGGTPITSGLPPVFSYTIDGSSCSGLTVPSGYAVSYTGGTFTVSKASQKITFTSTAPSNAVVGGPAYAVTATGGDSGNPVVVSVDSATTNNACSLGADGFTVSLDHSGTCVIDANQAGNAGYTAAAQVQQSFTVSKLSQTITFGAIADHTFGDPDFAVSATGGGSGNPVTFTAAGACTVTPDGSVVHLTGAGSCAITASQAGNADYQAAAPLTQPFQITKAAPVITWANPAGITWGTPLSGTQLDATASVAGTFTYTPKAGTVLSPGNNQVLSVSFTPANTADYTNAGATAALNVGFSPAACITKSFAAPLVIGNGQAYCVGTGATITSAVTIRTGGALYLTGGTITGPVSATSPSAIILCGAKVTGSVTITGATGPLSLGTCGTNTITGPVSLTGNTGGLTYQNTTVTGSLTITGNTGGTVIGPGNKTSGTVTIKNNT